MDSNKQIRKNMRELRKRNGLTQAQLASMLNLSGSAIQKMEVGKNGVSGENRVMLCNVFGISMEELMAKEINKCSLDSITNSDRYKNVQECINRFAAYNAELSSCHYQIRYSGGNIHSICVQTIMDAINDMGDDAYGFFQKNQPDVIEKALQEQREIEECIAKGIVSSKEEYCFSYRSQDYLFADCRVLERLCEFLYYTKSFAPEAFDLTCVDNMSAVDEEEDILTFDFESEEQGFSLYLPSGADNFQIAYSRYEVDDCPVGTLILPCSTFPATFEETLEKGIPSIRERGFYTNLKVLLANGLIHEGQVIDRLQYIELEKQYKDLLPKLCIKEQNGEE